MGRFFILILFIVGCNSHTEPLPIEEQSFRKARRDSLYEPLDKLFLTEFLPDSTSDFVLRKMDSESTGGFGYKISTVLGTYINAQGDKKMKLYISDASGAKSILGTGAWANLDFSKANEYTSEVEGHKYYYKMNTRKRRVKSTLW